MNGRVLWITGLSGAGKSTLAIGVINLLQKTNISPVFLDGDELRTLWDAASNKKSDHTRASRLELAKKYSALCKLLADQGHIVVIATISLFHEIHAWNRANLPGYFEVYLDIPKEELRRRDPKGIYKKFDTGLVSQVAGFDLPIDEPANSHLTIKFDSKKSIEELCLKISKDFLASAHQYK